MPVWGGTIGLDDSPVSISRTGYNTLLITDVALSTGQNFCSLYLMGKVTSASQSRAAAGGIQGGGQEA